MVYISKKKRKSKLHPRKKYNIFIEYINIPNQYLIYLIKRRKVRIYNASVIIFNKSTIKSITANLSSDLNPNNLTLIKESNG